ncbi:MAG: OsmC family protein [Chitinophagales bacterium]
MNVSKVKYLGDLRTEATHVRSGNKIITDAPPDNQGKGEAFSPTDLLVTSAASCMLTIMGIAARTHQIRMEGTTIEVIKIMADSPRRVAEMHAHLIIPDYGFSDKEKSILENAAKTCPVMLSLDREMKKILTFTYTKI